VKTKKGTIDEKVNDQAAAAIQRGIDEKLGIMEIRSLNGIQIKQQEEDIFRITASTSDVDRDEEIVEPSGVNNLDFYLKYNPVILFAHDHWTRPPIGKAVAGQVKPRSLELDIEFAPTPFAQEIKSLYEGGFMNSFSIGFIPVKREYTDEGIAVYTEFELLEVSAVSVPANANATIQRALEGACQKGLEFPIMESIIGRNESKRSKPEPKGESAEKRRILSLADVYLNQGEKQ